MADKRIDVWYLEKFLAPSGSKIMTGIAVKKGILDQSNPYTDMAQIILPDGTIIFVSMHCAYFSEVDAITAAELALTKYNNH